MPPFVVGGRFNGTLEKLGIDATLTPALRRPRRGERPHPDAHAWGWTSPPRSTEFNAKAINPQWPLALIRQGDLTIKGQLNDFTSEGKILGAYENYGAGEADYRLARKGDDLDFEYLNVKTEKGAAVAARGKVTLPTPKSELALDVTAQARGIDPQAIDATFPAARVRAGERGDQGQAHRVHLARPGLGLLLESRRRRGRLPGGPQGRRLHLRRRVTCGPTRAPPSTPAARPASPRGAASIVAADWNRLAYPLMGGRRWW